MDRRRGVDANEWLDIGLLLAAEMSFVGRYLSRQPWRNITPNEARAYADAGLDNVLFYEDDDKYRALGGFANGREDAQDFRSRLRPVGLAGAPGFATVDFWPKDWQELAVRDYFRGWRSVIGAQRLAGYGPHPVARLLFDAGGFEVCESILWPPHLPFDPRSHLHQVANRDLTHREDPDRRAHFGATGYVCDEIGLGTDFGQRRAFA